MTINYSLNNESLKYIDLKYNLIVLSEQSLAKYSI
jgi:hypothetical protein